MDYKTVLVQVDANPRSAARLQVARALAANFTAHLTALYAANPTKFLMSPISPEAAVMVGQAIEWDDRREANARAMVMAQCQNDGAHWDLLVDRGPPEAACLRHAVYADLLVLGQTDPEGGSEVPQNFAARVLCATSAPVLIVPHAGDISTVGQRILISWNASVQAARAVRGALPLLQRAAEVHIVTYDQGQDDLDDIPMPGANLATYLMRHGVNATVLDASSGNSDVARLLLAQATELGSDLIVMGGYGHSRAFEIVMGGMTRSVLASMTIPVLLAH